MNVNPNAINILCFGDSNTYGQKPDKTSRYAGDVRWTGRLQKLLGDDYYIIEEGLGGRTTDIDYTGKPGRNGRAYFMPTLQSHSPLDIVIIMAGSNDLKIEFRRSADEIAVALAGIVNDVEQYAKTKNGDAPQVILVSPTVINENAPLFHEFYDGNYDTESVQESMKLAAAIHKIARESGCEFVDAAQVAKAGEDGLHWDEESQPSFASAIEKSSGAADMKISVNWIRQLVDFELPEVDELTAKIGAQLGEVESVENLGEKYQGIIVAKVVECYKHENSDHLNVCKIDDGGKAQNIERDENGLVQVVCGAPNVREGLLVAWLPPGSTVPSSYASDPFVLEARDLRGVTSNGMLASAKELAISDEHDGILEIDKDASAGDDFAELYKLDDYVIDIENKMFTHRPDCFGALGVAREIAGILGYKFASPDWYSQLPKFEQADGLDLEVSNGASEKVPRFIALAMKNVEVKPSPIWLQVALAKIGQKPINNVVDITNFIMQLTAQPVHAYDYDKLRGHRLDARMAQKGEKVTLLNHKTYELSEDDIVIADGEGPVGLAGIMGGNDSEVSDETKNIVLEVATFDMYSVRKSSMKYGLFTDALTRFNKGQSPLQNDRVLAKLASMISQLASAEPASEIFDEKTKLASPSTVTTPARFINSRLGLSLAPSEIASLLANVEFAVEISGDELAVTAPFWRTDIEIPEDIVEEVGRLYGYDKLPLGLPKRSIKPASKNDLLELKASIRNKLASAGANEVLTYSFVPGKLLEKAGQDKQNAFELSNALSPDLQYYRLSLIPSLLEKVHGNIKAGYDKFAIFELGKVHIASEKNAEGLPREDDLVALVVAASDKQKSASAAYFQAKKYLESLVKSSLTYQPIPEAMQKFDITKPFDMNRSAFVYAGEKFLGIIGEFRPEVTRGLKLPKYCAGFELDTLALADCLDKITYQELPKYPKVEQDISLKIASDVSHQSLVELLNTSLAQLKPSNTLATLEPLDIYQKSASDKTKQVAFRLAIASYEKTLLASEVNELLDKLALAASNQFKAERI